MPVYVSEVMGTLGEFYHGVEASQAMLVEEALDDNEECDEQDIDGYGEGDEEEDGSGLCRRHRSTINSPTVKSRQSTLIYGCGIRQYFRQAIYR